MSLVVGSFFSRPAKLERCAPLTSLVSTCCDVTSLVRLFVVEDEFEDTLCLVSYEYDYLAHTVLLIEYLRENLLVGWTLHRKREVRLYQKNIF